MTTEMVNNSNTLVKELKSYLNSQIIGQENFVDRLLLALFADGHVLIEGAPGLAKTKAINVLSSAIDAKAKRIQFTPDLLPSDLVGTEVFRPENGSFNFQKGPLFNSLILADEINRAPAKVQSALLEAMAEYQISVAGKTHKLPDLFMVLATQNPIEQQGTYALPEAQLDRFLLKVNIDYPSAQAERKILSLIHSEAQGKNKLHESTINQEAIFKARQQALDTHVSESLTDYIVALIQATRYPHQYGDDLKDVIEFGASPRATLAIDRCARVYAWMQGRDFATPDDVQGILHDILKHRIILSFEAESEGKTTGDVITELLNRVPVA